jgi:heme exporter protein A
LSQILLEVQALSCEREGRVLFSDLSFQLAKGQVVQLAGPNGSGKTSLLRTVCGLVPLQRGDIYWCGEPLQKSRYQFAAEVLYLGHQTGIKPALSPRENLIWYFSLRQKVADGAIEAALTRVGLYGYEDSPCYLLSAGQQRRAALARLHVSDAKAWIIDEAFTAIDLQGVAELEDWIADYASEGGAVLLTTHHKLAAHCPVTVIDLGAAS